MLCAAFKNKHCIYNTNLIGYLISKEIEGYFVLFCSFYYFFFRVILNTKFTVCHAYRKIFNCIYCYDKILFIIHFLSTFFILIYIFEDLNVETILKKPREVTQICAFLNRLSIECHVIISCLSILFGQLHKS